MSSDLRDLYQEVILDHGKNPRNFRVIDDANHKAEGDNPLCGDNITLYLKTEDGTIVDVAFQGSGCAISKASASMMAAELKGKSTSDAEALFAKFTSMVTGEGDTVDPMTLGKLGVFVGVREFPSRVKCATLGWHTLHGALHEEERTSTE